MDENIKASLVVVDNNGNAKKLQLYDPNTKQLCEEVSLSILDYMLSSYGSLERYLSEAVKSNWIKSQDVEIKIVDTKGKVYALPFSSDRDLIFRCSEAACFRGGQVFIEKGEYPKMVSSSEFVDFFNEFLGNASSLEGHNLVREGFFNDYPRFSTLLTDYYTLSLQDDNMYAKAEANKIEKGREYSHEPRSIEDYLRFYPIFRNALDFNRECRGYKHEMERYKEQKRLKEEKYFTNEQHEAAYYNGKRSLCYVIGNNCEPLILETRLASEIDDYIVDKYEDARTIKRKYEDKIKEYVFAHKEYVKEIRERISNPNYSGQLTILEHNADGTFKRLPSGAYMRYPVVYSKTFKDVKKLYCNVGRLRKQVRDLENKVTSLDNRSKSAQAKALAYVQNDLSNIIEDLEKEKQVTKAELQSVYSQLNRIVNDMKSLEKNDFAYSISYTKPRIFSKYLSRSIAYVKASSIPKKFEQDLDDWAKEIETSPHRYDNIRFIMRHLRQKNDNRLEEDYVEKVEKEKYDPTLGDSYNHLHIKEEELPPEKDDTLLTDEEIRFMYDAESMDEVNHEDLERDHIRHA